MLLAWQVRHRSKVCRKQLWGEKHNQENSSNDQSEKKIANVADHNEEEFYVSIGAMNTVPFKNEVQNFGAIPNFYYCICIFPSSCMLIFKSSTNSTFYYLVFYERPLDLSLKVQQI